MSNEVENRASWRGVIPRGRPAVVGAVIVAIVAFFLGGLLLSGGSSVQLPNSEKGEMTSAAAGAEPTIWTCSMHPQIRLPKPGKCPICFMDLIPVTTGGGEDLGPRQLRMSKTAKKLAQIQTTPVMRAFAEREIRMVGKLDYDETRLSYITAWVPGRLDKMFIDFTGAGVAKGDPLVQIYSPELISAQQELLQAIKAVSALSNTSSSVLQSTAVETVRSAREKLRLLGLSNSQVKAIEASEEPSDHLTLYAPISGVVIQKDAKEGMYVSTGTRIYAIADLSQMWVMLEAYESDLPWLQNGQHIAFSSPSFPGETFDAVISFIDPILDAKTRTVNVRAIVKNGDGRLKPEMFVSGLVRSRLDDGGNVTGSALTNNPDAPLVIPATAPLITGKRAVVYVELPNDDGPLFEGREVTLGPRAGDYYVVRDGLKEGDQVVTNGAFRIDSELQIQAKPSMMSPDGGATMTGHQHDHAATASDKQDKVESERPDAVSSQENGAPQAALTPLYNEYFALQMSLADDNLEEAKGAFSKVADIAESIDMELFRGESHAHWMEISKALISACSKGTDAEDIAAARDAFFYASKAVISLHDTFGHSADASFYLTFCPMARDNAGAYWLQTVDTVYNSFYGKSMLRCGEIKKQLSASGGESELQPQMTHDPLTSVYHAYFRLERALTFEDLAEIQEAYHDLAKQINDWSEKGSAFTELAQQAMDGAENSELAAARDAFRSIADGILALHEKYGHSEPKDYYLIYCPHATADGGASWLQDVDTMYHPFLGGVMPQCTEEKIALPPGEGKAR